MRREDQDLLTGRMRFAGDIAPAGSLHLVFARSRLAHADVVALDLARARAVPGVVAVFAATELEQLGARPMPCSLVTDGQQVTAVPLLAEDTVRYVGQPLAAVLAEDRYVAEDAARLVDPTLEPREAVVDVEHALEPDAPLLHPDWGTNLVAEATVGGGDVDRTLAEAEIRVRTRLRFQRQAPSPLEARAVVAEPHADGNRLTLWLSTQSAHHARAAIAAACGWEEDRMRVVCPAVGGSFGLKEYVYPEDAIVALLAAHVGRPVRWTEDRSENLTAACHARESLIDLELGADADGRLHAVDCIWLWDVGGNPSSHGLGPARFGAAVLTGPYRVDACRVLVRGVVTNKAPIGGYRGYGAPQAQVAIERALDALAAELGLDPFEIRRRNLIAPTELPWSMPSGVTIDSGDYPAAFEAMVTAGRGAAAETVACGAEARVGLGVVPYVMVTGIGPSKGAAGSGVDHGSYETAYVRIDRQGRAVVHVGTSSQGQGHMSLHASVAATTLGFTEDRVRVVTGDTDLTPYSPVSAVGSRTAAVVAQAVRAACEPLGDKLRRQAAHEFGCDPAEVIMGDGEVLVTTPSGVRTRPIAEIVQTVQVGINVAPGIEPGLESVATIDPAAATITYGVHAAVIEVDPPVGEVRVRRYLALDDCGPRLRPDIVEGQLRGGIAQGIGSALLEEVRHDEKGQPLTSSLSEYLLPIADLIPTVELHERVTPSPVLPGGSKGIGEAGIFGPPAAIAQALDDALGRPAAILTQLPLSLERVALGAAEEVAG